MTTVTLPTTNAQVFRNTTRPICEYNPDTGKLSRLSDPFHATATVSVGTREPLRVCGSCAHRPEHRDKAQHRITKDDWGGLHKRRIG